MKSGDLVEVWGKPSIVQRELDGPHHIGILVDYDHSDDGWRVLVNEKIETFVSTWWSVIKVGKNESR